MYVQPSVIRWTHGTFQKMFICVRLLVDVARQLKNQLLTPEELPMIEVVKHQGKWYSQNNRRLWCFKEAAISVVKARIGQEDNHFLRRVNTVSDGWTVNFFPPCICKKCSIEFPNRKELRWHACKEVMKTSALDWEDQVSEASDDSCSEDGDYGEDGFWTERRICVFAVFLCCVVGIVAVGVVVGVVVAVVVVVVVVFVVVVVVLSQSLHLQSLHPGWYCHSAVPSYLQRSSHATVPRPS